MSTGVPGSAPKFFIMSPIWSLPSFSPTKRTFFRFTEVKKKEDGEEVEHIRNFKISENHVISVRNTQWVCQTILMDGQKLPLWLILSEKPYC